MAGTGFWKDLSDTSIQPDRSNLRLWAWLRQKLDLAFYKPQAIEGAEVSHLTSRDGEYHVLKNPDKKTYFQISERDYFLWEQMDGTKSVKDLVVEYFLKYGSFAFARIANLVFQLKANYLLADQPINVYGQVRLQMLKQTMGYRLQRFGSAFMHTPFAISGLDEVFSKIYRYGGWLLITKPIQIVYVLISVVGLALFFRIFSTGEYSLVTSVNGSYLLGLVALAIILLFALLIHELAHALTVKHYGREVRRAGFIIYIGTPGFFVDTSDIWMEGKRARLAVTWAGPFSGLVLSGIAAIILTTWPEFSLNPVLFRFAFLSYMIVFMNVNPLLKLDGYYLLMDWLEIANLRSKSFAFLRNGLPAKFKRQPEEKSKDRESGHWFDRFGSFSREELIFTVFGLLSALWTAYAVYLAFSIWQTRMVEAVNDLINWGGDLTRLPVAILILVLSFLFLLSITIFVLRLLSGALERVSGSKIFNNTWYVAGILLVLFLSLLVVVYLFPSLVLVSLIGTLSLCAAMYFAWKMVNNFWGSRYLPFFALVGLAALTLLAGEVLVILGDISELGVIGGDSLSYGLEILALVLLLVASLSLWNGRDLKTLSLGEKIVIAVGILISLGWVLAEVYTARGISTSLVISLGFLVLPILTLTLLLPTVISYWQTKSAPAWTFFSLALVSIIALTFLNFHQLTIYLLLAASLTLHDLAFKLLPLSSHRPEARTDISDKTRLQRSFNWLVAGIYDQFEEVVGGRESETLVGRFNQYSASARWDIKLEAGHVQDKTSVEPGLIELGELYAAALTLLLDLFSKQVGEKLTVRMLQNGYDGLPWEEREIGGLYCFKHVGRAEVLSQEFIAVRSDYTALLRRMPLFATMSDKEIDLLLTRIKLARHRPGKFIIRQGERGDRFYIIKQGHVEVTQTDENGVTEVVNQLSRGDYFGELALLDDAPRNATCKSTIPTETLTLSKRDFDELVKERFVMREKLDDSITRADLLRRIPLFSEMDGIQIQHIAANLQEHSYQAGDIFIHQGEIGETFFVIKTGRVQVYVTQEGEQSVVAERGPGEFVGEVALLLDVPRTASVKALSSVTVLTLHKEDFSQLINEHLYISRKLERESSRRMIDLRRAALNAD